MIFGSSHSVVSLCDPMDYSPPESSLHGILQARILKGVAISSTRRPWPRDRPRPLHCKLRKQVLCYTIHPFRWFYLMMSGLGCGMRNLCRVRWDLLLLCTSSLVVEPRLNSCCAWAPEHRVSVAVICSLSSCGMWAPETHAQWFWCSALLFHSVWDHSSPIRDGTRIPCIARVILNHWTTRKVHLIRIRRKMLSKYRKWKEISLNLNWHKLTIFIDFGEKHKRAENKACKIAINSLFGWRALCIPVKTGLHCKLNTKTVLANMGYVCACSVVSDRLASQAPLSMECFRQEYWSGYRFPSPGDLPDSGTEPESFASCELADRFFTIWAKF